ncbi:MAG: hypothetical protein LC687_02435 [Actinobacteria bacterium]|nr:hypothetical protein [Actinomycetota bacterium]
MEENKVISIVYTLFLGLLLAVFVGFGIRTFYAPPESPEYPEPRLEQPQLEPNESNEAERMEKDAAYQSEYEAYQSEIEVYHRNVSIASLLIAVGFLVFSLTVGLHIKVLSDGILLGGLFLLIYSIGRSFAAEDPAYSFVTLAVAVVIALYLGYRRFNPQKS